MIKYEGTEKKYRYSKEALDKVLALLANRENYNMFNCTQEKLAELTEAINEFISSFEEIQVPTVLERHETEEEAREYFGSDFVERLNGLFTSLDKSQVSLFLHGTSPSLCPKICETGLRYKSPNLLATACLQPSEFGEKDIEYKDFEGLLNWGHKDYKGLVIVAVPIECYYKEGLWSHPQESDYPEYGYDYLINPEFIVGYIDVENKKIVLNPRYKRQHDYTGLEPDIDLYHEQKDMTNEHVIEQAKELLGKLKQDNETIIRETPNDEEELEDIDPEEVIYKVEVLSGLFNSLTLTDGNEIGEDRYKYLITQFAYYSRLFQKILPEIPTAEDLKRREEEAAKNDPFADYVQVPADYKDEYSWDEVDLPPTLS